MVMLYVCKHVVEGGAGDTYSLNVCILPQRRYKQTGRPLARLPTPHSSLRQK